MIEKNSEDVEALKAIIAEQKAHDAEVSEDLNCRQYTWDENSGRLVGISWAEKGLSENLNVSGCKALTHLSCYNNQLLNLDVTNCTKLESLQADDTTIITGFQK